MYVSMYVCMYCMYVWNVGMYCITQGAQPSSTDTWPRGRAPSMPVVAPKMGLRKITPWGGGHGEGGRRVNFGQLGEPKEGDLTHL